MMTRTRKITALAIAAASAGLLITGLTTTGQSYDLTHEDTGNNACWVEKVHSIDTAEVICGDRGDRPQSDTADIGQRFGGNPNGDGGWYAQYYADSGFDFEPIGWN